MLRKSRYLSKRYRNKQTNKQTNERTQKKSLKKQETGGKKKKEKKTNKKISEKDTGREECCRLRRLFFFFCVKFTPKKRFFYLKNRVIIDDCHWMCCSLFGTFGSSFLILRGKRNSGNRPTWISFFVWFLVFVVAPLRSKNHPTPPAIKN